MEYLSNFALNWTDEARMCLQYGDKCPGDHCPLRRLEMDYECHMKTAIAVLQKLKPTTAGDTLRQRILKLIEDVPGINTTGLNAQVYSKQYFKVTLDQLEAEGLIRKVILKKGHGVSHCWYLQKCQYVDTAV